MKTTTYYEACKSLFMNKPALRKLKNTTTNLSFSSILIVFLVSIVSPNLSAQIQLTADIFPGNTGSGVTEFAVYNNKLYFSANDGTVGQELYMYDGTNVSLVADINLGTANSLPQQLTVYNNKLYFTASDGSVGRELWVYDGTTASLVADINPGTNSSSPNDLTVYNNKLYFRANTAFTGVELWEYDGTTATLVNDINPSGSSSPSFLTVYNNKLYFQANNGVTGFELWVYDGATTALVQDIRPGSGNSFPKNLTVYNNKLYFQANNGSSGSELLVYDGVTTSLVADIRSGTGSSSPEFLTVFNNKLFFRADDGIAGQELWVYDGANAVLAADINPGTIGSFPTDLTVFNNKLYFRTDDGIAGQELWVYDGLTASLVDDYLPGIGGSSPAGLIVYGNTLYFQASDFDGTNGPNIHGAELCEYSPCSTTFGTDVQTACNTFTWIDNNTYTVSNNTATFNIANGAANGCDSLVTLDLTIINSATGTDVQTACNTFTWIDNNTYTASNNTATFNIANGAANGCDSLVTLNLTITTVDNSTTLNANTISANQNGATYRWLDCDNGNAVISGETAQSFTPTATGNYAVEVTLGSCVDTSACTNVIITSIDESIMENVNIFPNPTKDDIYVELPLNEFTSVEVKIYSVTGKLVYNASQNNVSKLSISTANWDKGIYFIQLISNNQTITEKIIKQ